MACHTTADYCLMSRTDYDVGIYYRGSEPPVRGERRPVLLLALKLGGDLPPFWSAAFQTFQATEPQENSDGIFQPWWINRSVVGSNSAKSIKTTVALPTIYAVT